MTDKTVTQADRDRFAEYLEAHGRPATATEMRAGRMDDDDGLLMLARHRLAQSDAQMAAPDALAAELAALDAKATPGPWDVVEYNDAESLAIHDRARNWRVCFMATPGSTGSMEAILASADLIVALRNNLPAILASLSASNAMRDALGLVAAMMAWVTEDDCPLRIANDHTASPFDIRWEDVLKIRAALADQATTLDRQTVERMDTLRTALGEAAFTFETYAKLHSAKGTSDGHEKAAKNAKLAERMREAIRASMDPNRVR